MDRDEGQIGFGPKRVKALRKPRMVRMFAVTTKSWARCDRPLLAGQFVAGRILLFQRLERLRGEI